MSILNRPGKSSRSCTKGMTLVEVLFAISIFAIGILAASLMLGNSLSYSNSARRTTEATEIARHKLERLLSAPYRHADLDAATSPHGPVTTGDYQLRWTIQQDVPIMQMKTIDITVSWRERGVDKRLSVSAIRQ